VRVIVDSVRLAWVSTTNYYYYYYQRQVK